MKLLNLYEPAVDAVLARLAGKLPAYVDAVNALYPDGPAIEAPAPENLLPYVPPLDQVVAFPTIGIGRLPGHLEDDTGYAATGAYGVSLCVFVQDADQGTLTKLADRTLRAVASCVLDGRSWGDGDGTPYAVGPPQFIPGAALADRPGPNMPPTAYMTWMGVAVQVKLDE